MDTVDLKLAQDCEALAVAASEGVGWLKDAAKPVADRGAAGAVADQRAAEGSQPEPQARARRPPPHVRRRVRPEPGRQVLSRARSWRAATAARCRRASPTRPTTSCARSTRRAIASRPAWSPASASASATCDARLPGARAAADPDRHRQDPRQLLPARLRSPEGGVRAARRRSDPQAPGRAAHPGAADAAGRPRCRRRARPDRVFRHLLRRRDRRSCAPSTGARRSIWRRACRAATAPSCGRCCGTTSSPSPTFT